MQGLVSLVPDEQGATFGYWCTWAAQNYVYGHGSTSLDMSILEGAEGAQLARDSLDEAHLFGEEGWLRRFHPSVRRDLFVVLDDGWDVPRFELEQSKWFGSLELDELRFPPCRGNPQERLARLSQRVTELGWRGLGIWVAAQEAPRYQVDDYARWDYWVQRLRWSHWAGVRYWKVDWGTQSEVPGFRRTLTKLAHREAPGLVIEHIGGAGPVNNWANGRVSQEYVDIRKELFTFSDVVRSYDVTAPLSIPTTLDRLAAVLDQVTAEDCLGIINCEDEPTIAAGLGCAVGVMRHPLRGLRLGGDPDVFTAGPRQIRRCMDEVTRGVRWQRLAPPFAINGQGIILSQEVLWDDWTFRRGETWATSLIGRCVRQGAPGRVARGLPLPKVRGDGGLPYVIASKNPNGAISVATLGRTSSERGWYAPLADVSLDVGDAKGPFGVFGRYQTLTLEFCYPIGSRVLAQDLAGESPHDITSMVAMHGNRLVIPGRLIDEIGLEAASQGDFSPPGLVLALR